MKKTSLIIGSLALLAAVIGLALYQGFVAEPSAIISGEATLSQLGNSPVIYTGIRADIASVFASVFSGLQLLTGGSVIFSIILLALLIELVLLHPSVLIQLKQKKIHLFHKKLVDRFNSGELSLSSTKHELAKLYSVNEAIHKRGARLVAIQVAVFLATLWGLNLLVGAPHLVKGTWNLLNSSLLGKPQTMWIPFFAAAIYFSHSIIKVAIKNREDYIAPMQTIAALVISAIFSAIILAASSAFATALTLYFVTQVTFATIRYLFVEQHAQSWGKLASKHLIEMLKNAEPHKDRFEHISRKWRHLPVVRHLNFHLLEEALSMSLGLLLALNFFGLFQNTDENPGIQAGRQTMVPSSYAAEFCSEFPVTPVLWLPGKDNPQIDEDTMSLYGDYDYDHLSLRQNIAGFVDKGIDLRRTTDFVQVSGIDALENAEVFTAEFWFRWNGTPGTIFQTGNGVGLTAIDPDADGIAFMAFHSVDPTEQDPWGVMASTYGAADALQDNRWSHIAAIVDPGDIRNSRLFIDGTEKVLDDVTPGGHISQAGSDTLYIGKPRSSAGSFSNVGGIIDEFTVYDRAIAVSQIEDIVDMIVFGKCGALCGDNVKTDLEACDDGNEEGGDGCNATCDKIEVCGDGTLDTGEVCDDGNTEDGDGCNATCSRAEACGNGFIDANEECDDGDNNPFNDSCYQCQSLPTSLNCTNSIEPTEEGFIDASHWPEDIQFQFEDIAEGQMSFIEGTGQTQSFYVTTSAQDTLQVRAIPEFTPTGAIGPAVFCSSPINVNERLECPDLIYEDEVVTNIRLLGQKTGESYTFDASQGVFPNPSELEYVPPSIDTVIDRVEIEAYGSDGDEVAVCEIGQIVPRIEFEGCVSDRAIGSGEVLDLELSGGVSGNYLVGLVRADAQALQGDEGTIDGEEILTGVYQVDGSFTYTAPTLSAEQSIPPIQITAIDLADQEQDDIQNYAICNINQIALPIEMQGCPLENNNGLTYASAGNPILQVIGGTGDYNWAVNDNNGLRTGEGTTFVYDKQDLTEGAVVITVADSGNGSASCQFNITPKTIEGVSVDREISIGGGLYQFTVDDFPQGVDLEWSVIPATDAGTINAETGVYQSTGNPATTFQVQVIDRTPGADETPFVSETFSYADADCRSNMRLRTSASEEGSPASIGAALQVNPFTVYPEAGYQFCVDNSVLPGVIEASTSGADIVADIEKRDNCFVTRIRPGDFSTGTQTTLTIKDSAVPGNECAYQIPLTIGGEAVKRVTPNIINVVPNR